MNVKWIVGSTLAAAVIGLAGLAGSVAAQTPTNPTTPTTPSTQTAPQQQTPSTTPGTTNPGEKWGGMMGGRGGRHGGGDFDGFGGFGKFGANATAENATSAIDRATTVINLAKTDLAYAQGKMDTANIQKWISGAESLLANAKTASGKSNYEQAVGYARSADELTEIAESQMATALGADKLPSYSQNQNNGRPFFGGKMFGNTTTTPTQSQASRVLSRTYNQIVAQGALIKSGEGLTYLTDAQNAYKTAYAAYQAGKYQDAVNSAMLAERLLKVAGSVNAASQATGTDNPVTVPSPNF